MRHNKLAIIIPFYAKRLPNYFNYWLKSLPGKCFDILLVSDMDIPDADNVENLKQIRLSFDGLRALIREKISSDAVLTKPYKLCDYKPFYGKIFSDHLSGYEYFGWGDCDLVYGEAINALVTGAIDGGCDAFSITEHWVSGGFTFYRNESRFTELYRKAANWQDIVTNEAYCGFDELGGGWFNEIYAGRMTKEECFDKVESWSKLVFAEPGIKFIHHDFGCERALADDFVVIRDGRVFYDDKEYALFHFVSVKSRYYYFIPKRTVSEIGSYWIDGYGLYASDLQWKMRPIVRTARRAWTLISKIPLRAKRYLARRNVS